MMDEVRQCVDPGNQLIEPVLEAVVARLDVVAREVEPSAYVWLKAVGVHGQSDRVEGNPGLPLVDRRLHGDEGGRSDRLHTAV